MVPIVTTSSVLLFLHDFNNTSLEAKSTQRASSAPWPLCIFSTSDYSDVLLVSKVRKLQFGLKCTDRPQMYSCLIGWQTELANQTAVHLRPITECMEFGLKCTEFHTFEANLIYFVMWCVWANRQTEKNRPQMYGIGLKCTDLIDR